MESTYMDMTVNERWKRYRQRKYDEGLCVRCGRRPRGEARECKECSARAMTNRVRSRLDKGMCLNCGCRKPKEGCKWCAHCLLEKQKTQIDLGEERRERGMCPGCGRRQPKKGRVYCSVCAGKMRERTRRWREKNGTVRCKETP